MKNAIDRDPTLIIRSVASMFGSSKSTIYYNFKHLRLVSKFGEWSPHDLRPFKLQQRVHACQRLLLYHRTFNWLNNVITGDEKWVLYTNYQRNRQWLSPVQKAKSVPKVELHPQKRMLCVWWDIKGVVY